MRSRLLSLFAFLVLAAIPSHAVVQSRIAAINTSSRVALPHSVPALAKASADLGAASANLKLDSLTMFFNITAAQQATLTQLLIDQQNPSSPRYHQWLTPEQFGAQFGLSSQDLAKVSQWLTSQGFTVTGTAPSSNFLTFTGSAAQVEQAFGTSIHNVSYNGEQHYSNLTDPVLPASIAAVVGDIAGLNNFKLRARARTRVAPANPSPDALHPQFTSATSGNNFVAPGDFYKIYNINTSSLNGTGVTIAVMGQTDISLTDVSAFRTSSGFTGTTLANLPKVKLFGTDPGTVTADVAEAQLDVEWSGAVAPMANILYVLSNNVISGSLANAIATNVAPIITISYGDCESNFGLSTITSLNVLLQQANAQGQTVVGPAGDSGATDCDYNTYPAANGLAVDYPASSPYATAAGGSMFNEGSGTYWLTANGTDVLTSATGYIPETVWNESSATNGLGAGGGGASAYFTKPYWQAGIGVPADSARDVPDISLNAASGHDGYLYCASGACMNGFRNSSGNLDVVGGTSVAAPSFAGMLALVEQTVGSSLGNVNPMLYALAKSSYSANVFHDITTGNNSSACVAGTQDCPLGGTIGFSAGVGYDLATGWGSIDATNLATYWSQVTPLINTTGIGTKVSTTTVATTGALCGAANGTIVLNISVADANSSSLMPSGTVQILVDNVPNGAPVALVNGAASYSLKTAGLASGGRVISAVYSGDGTYSGSKNTVDADVVSSTVADFAFTPCTATTSATSGSNAAGITLTVAPVNGFSGAVTFTATSNDSTLSSQYTFTPTTVTTSGTTTFVLSAYKTSVKGATGMIKADAGRKPFGHTSSGKAPWYAAGSGVALACMLLLTVPRRRRWTGLLVLALSVGAMGAIGCSGNSAITNTTGGGTTPVTTNATPGTYNIRVTATSGTLVHSVNVTFTVQ